MLPGDSRVAAGFPLTRPARTALRPRGAAAALLLAFLHPEAPAGESPPDLSSGGHDVRVLALSGQTAPDGNGTIGGLRTSPPLVNHRGQVLMIADIHAPDIDIDAQALLLSHGPGDLRQLLRTGETLPGGASFGWLQAAADICLSDAGHVAVHVPVDAADRVLNVVYRIDADGRIAVLHEGDRHRGLAGGFALSDHGQLMLESHAAPRPVFNARGQVAFQSRREILLAEPDGSIRVVVRVGDELARGQVTEILFAGDAPCRSGFNDAGQLVFYARLAVAGEERDGVFLVEPSGSAGESLRRYDPALRESM